jgi:hypothetical protein
MKIQIKGLKVDRTKIKWYLKEDYSMLMIRQEDKAKVPVSQSNHWRNCMSLLQVFIFFYFLSSLKIIWFFLFFFLSSLKIIWYLW